jgi:hypothetical protein
MSLAFWSRIYFFGGFDDHGAPPDRTRFKADTMRHSSLRFEVTENDMSSNGGSAGNET